MTFDQELRGQLTDGLMTPNQNWKGMKKIPIELLWNLEGPIKALIKKHQPKRKKPSGYNMMFEYDYYNEALTDSDKAYGIES